MPIVSEYLKDLIKKQVDDKGIVVWFDPEEHYREFIENLTLESTTIIRYKGSFIGLRHEVDLLLNDIKMDRPPRLIVYVPVAEENTHNALVELTIAGIVMKPGAPARQRNTRLSVIAKAVFRDMLNEEEAEKIKKQVDEGKLTLTELDIQAERRKGGTFGVLGVIFGKDDIQRIALAFLGTNEYDGKITKKKALGELIAHLESEYEITFSDDSDIEAVRKRFARHVLSTEFIDNLTGEVPAALSTVKIPKKTANRTACTDLTRAWRSYREYRDEYLSQAKTVEKELRLGEIELKAEAMLAAETFLAVEEKLQCSVEEAFIKGYDKTMMETARRRQSMFWSESLGRIQARWSLVSTIGNLLNETTRMEGELKSATSSPGEFIRRYTEGKNPWCLFDTYHRRMENKAHSFDFEPKMNLDSLDRLLAKARDRYMDIGGKMAQTFLELFSSTGFEVSNVKLQTDTYRSFVGKALERGKTAYILADALRYEMARELAENLREQFQTEITPLIGMFPSTTRIGMAALMPEAGKGYKLKKTEKKMLPAINGNELKEKSDRMKYLKKYVGGVGGNKKPTIAILNLSDFQQMLKTIKNKVKKADFIVITSMEIDKLGEGETLIARSAMNAILGYLARTIRALFQLGCDNIILTSDHGYLFGEVLKIDMKIPSPGGKIVELHRRAWVGMGGSTHPSVYHGDKLPFGLNDEIEFAVPKGFGVFEVRGGNKAYFHGGLSPQEIIIPVVSLKPKEKAMDAGPTKFSWELVPGSKKITTRFLSVTIKAKAGGFGLSPPQVKVEIRDGDDKKVTESVSASYGFIEATKEMKLNLEEKGGVEIEPNTVTLQLTDDSVSGRVCIYLLDATTGTTLQKLKDIEVSLSL